MSEPVFAGDLIKSIIVKNIMVRIHVDHQIIFAFPQRFVAEPVTIHNEQLSIILNRNIFLFEDLQELPWFRSYLYHFLEVFTLHHSSGGSRAPHHVPKGISNM